MFERMTGGERSAAGVWHWLARATLARPWTFAAMAAALFLGAAPFAARLYADLHTDLRELLPRGAPAAVALDELERRVGGLGQLSVVVETADFEAGKRFLDALGARLQRHVGTILTQVRWKNDDDRDFVERHGSLLASVEDLTRLRDGISKRVKEAKGKANPLAVDLQDDEEEGAAKEQPIALDDEARAALERLRKEVRKVDRFRDGYIADAEGRTLVLTASPDNAAIALNSNLVVLRAVEKEVAALDPRSFHPSLRVGYTGEVRSVIEAQEHLVEDLKVSSVLTLLAVGGVLLLYFRTPLSIPILIAPLFTGAALTFAISRPVILALNPNTAFLGSIIIGNGLNAGVILLARYLEERRRGLSVEEALPVALSNSWVATLAAGAAAAASYGSLAATAFRGFSQFAFIGATGMLLCWLTTYAFAPALIVLFERWRPLAERGPRKHLVAVHLGRWLVASPWPAVVLTTALGLASTVALVPFVKDPIEYDFDKLGSKQGAIDGAEYWAKQVDRVTQAYQTPTVVLTGSEQEAERVAAAVRAEKARQGPGSPIDSVLTLDGLVAGDQPRKIALLREVFDLLEPRVIEALPADLRGVATRLKERTELRPYGMQDLPPRVQKMFREKDGATGRVVLVYPTLGATSAHGREQLAYVRAVRTTALAADPQAQVAGGTILSADIVETITHDGFRATGLSFVMVALLTLVALRGLASASWTMGSLALGTLWLIGALGAMGIKLNFVNFVVLPITFGIGIDYAVNLYQRYRQDGDVAGTVASSGGAVALCSSTTIIGYSALLLADNRAIFSFGATAVLGELTTLAAAVIALPAWLALRERRRRQGG